MANIEPGNATLPVDVKAEKRAFAQAKTDHDLHVLLLMNKFHVSKANAIVKAYVDGRGGIAALLAK